MLATKFYALIQESLLSDFKKIKGLLHVDSLMYEGYSKVLSA